MSQPRIFYKGNNEDFIVFLDDLNAYDSYVNKSDTTVPLTEVLGNFDVYRSCTGNGSTGKLEIASMQELSEEFGDFGNVEDDIIPLILRTGEVQNRGKLSKGKKNIDGGNNLNKMFGL
ncbi:Rtc3 protein [Martiniozyma asiatica (nom. inval.)]|nr:Rtc3 protein [Martiniozyma asiatica]